jgi:hypothetical protein
VLAVSYKPLDAAAEAALFEYPTSPEKDDDEAALESSLCVDRDIIAVDFFLVVAREAWKSSWIIFCSKEVVAVFSVPGSCFTGHFGANGPILGLAQKRSGENSVPIRYFRNIKQTSSTMIYERPQDPSFWSSSSSQTPCQGYCHSNSTGWIAFGNAGNLSRERKLGVKSFLSLDRSRCSISCHWHSSRNRKDVSAPA